jgi:hypothetical protein
MTSLVQEKIRAANLGKGLRIAAVLMVCLGFWSGMGRAKENGLTAIELYDGPSGAAYVQLTNVLISAKLELRVTGSADTPMDHGSYNKLNKTTMSVGGVLERGADGVLRYTGTDGQTVIVVPMNAKFEHGASLTPAQLADQAVLHGAPAESVQQLGRGVKLVFVEAADQEYAEYLRAMRASDIPGWRAYLDKYPAAKHVDDAKNRLGALYAQGGESALDSYTKSATSAAPDYNSLKSARTFAEEANGVAPDMPEVKKLNEGVESALAAILSKSRSELDAYNAALKGGAAGYGHLGTAKSLVETANGIEITKNGNAVLSDVMKAYDAVQGAMRRAESSATAKQYDLALSAVDPYRSFAGEEPRIAAVIDADYKYHMDAGKRAAAQSSWDTAIAEFEKAEKAKGTPEERSQLANARDQWKTTQDKAAAQKAQAESASYEQQKDILKAYEVLDELPDSQRKLVQDDLGRLQPAYIQRCSQVAKEVRQAHEPIRGVSDEEGIEEAYHYLAKAYKLSGDESYHDRMDLLGDELSAYLLDQAKGFLAKPSGSGTELGWTYLSEAFSYRASNLSDVRDAMTAAEPAHTIRSVLSIRVQFRDQTSQREGAGFAPQLENAVIAGLEGSKIPIKVVREGETTPVDTDYQIEGDVLRHHLGVDPKIETVESQFLESTREVVSEDWNKANRAYEKAQMELTTAQSSLQGAQAKGNKHQVEDLAKSAEEAEKNVEDAHVALDATPKTVTENVIRPYTYMKKTVTLTGSIEMQFRVFDSFSSEREAMIPIDKEEPKTYTVLQNVKPEDTTGVKDVGVEVNQAEFLTGVENDAVNELVAAVRQRVEQLPHKIYDKAKQRESEEDLAGAGEAYLRYLELLPNDTSADAVHARQFLRDQFNMSPASIVAVP